MKQRLCKTCRYWDAHSLNLELGDCRAPGDHRYWRIPMRDKNNVIVSHAMMDSFERQETRPNYSCGAWDDGAHDPPIGGETVAKP